MQGLFTFSGWPSIGDWGGGQANEKGDRPMLPALLCPVLSAHALIKKGAGIVKQ